LLPYLPLGQVRNQDAAMIHGIREIELGRNLTKDVAQRWRSRELPHLVEAWETDFLNHEIAGETVCRLDDDRADAIAGDVWPPSNAPIWRKLNAPPETDLLSIARLLVVENTDSFAQRALTDNCLHDMVVCQNEVGSDQKTSSAAAGYDDPACPTHKACEVGQENIGIVK